jgi:hypothetical protein
MPVKHYNLCEKNVNTYIKIPSYGRINIKYILQELSIPNLTSNIMPVKILHLL